MVKSIFSWYLKYKIHLLIWLLYMLYEALTIGILFKDFKSPIIYLSHYTVVFALFYINAEIVLPNGFKGKRNPIVLGISLILEITIYIGLQYMVGIMLVYFDISKAEVIFNSAFVLRNLYRGLLFLGFSTGYYYLKTYLVEKQKTEQLEQERLKNIIQQQKIEQELVLAQNAFLKAQINPHFLFNTLDFVYHKVNTHSVVAGEVIIKLAEMMRFAIDSAHLGQTILLQQEIEQVENLIYLYEARKPGKLNISFEYDRQVEKLYLVPLVLLTLVENIFKHGDLSKENETAFIRITIVNDVFKISTFNLAQVLQNVQSNHSGLNNIKNRLYYIYGEQVKFEYHKVANHFQVLIEIPLSLVKKPF